MHGSGPPIHYGALWTLRTSLTPGVCTHDREIRTETPAGQGRSKGEMTQPKLATLSHIGLGSVVQVFSSLRGLCSMLPWHSMVAAPCHVSLPSCSASSDSVLVLCGACGNWTSGADLSSTCGLMMSARIASLCFPRPRFELGLSSRVPQISTRRVRQSCSIKSRTLRSSVTMSSMLARPRLTSRYR